MQRSPPARTTVSVVVATYNYARWLPQAIRSVQAQTWRDWECVIVDDASSDATASVAAGLLRGDRRLRYLRNRRNLGEAAARNVGNAAACGEYIAVLDADDTWHPQKLEQQLAAMAGAPEAVLCFTAPTLPVERTERVAQYLENWARELGRSLLRENNVTHSSVLLPRRVLDEVGGYDERLPYAVDWDLWLRLLHRYGAERLIYLNQPLVHYRIHDGNMSSNSARACRGMRAVVRKHLWQNGWALRHPAAAWAVLEAQLDREWRLLAHAGQRNQARLAGLQWVALGPFRRWRWSRLRASWRQPAGLSTYDSSAD
jgi:glycosyltransferase involved in cell wall biosynthesis